MTALHGGDPELRDGRPAQEVVAAAAAVVAVLGLWLALAWATGLIYHLLPGATSPAAAWAFRRTHGLRRIRHAERAFIIATGTSGSVLGAWLVSAIGRQLDDPVATATVVLAGAVVAAYWLRRREPEPPVGAAV